MKILSLQVWLLGMTHQRTSWQVTSGEQLKQTSGQGEGEAVCYWPECISSHFLVLNSFHEM